MKYNTKLFLSSMIITITLITGLMLMPFAEYNSSRYIVGEVETYAGFSFDEKLSLPQQDEKIKLAKALCSLLPAELRTSAEIIEKTAEYIGEAG